jgi:PKD repeat protein
MPAADFIASPVSGSAPLMVQFADISTVNPGLINGWLWDFGDGNKAYGQNPLHVYYAPAKYDVKLTVSSLGCKSEILKSQFIASPVEHNNHNSQLKIYPNPAHNTLTIDNPLSESATILMSDVLGKTILEKKIIPGINSVNVENFKPGLYFIFVDGMSAGKFLIE